MIIGKSKRELEKMRAAGRLAGLVLQKLRSLVKPGVTTIDLDRIAEKMIRDAGALPTFKGYNGFPYSICASVNEQIVHGFPSSYALKEGDIFSIDCGVTLEGFVGDTATTVPVGEVDEERLKLIRITEECLERAIQQCRAGNHLGDIGWGCSSTLKPMVIRWFEIMSGTGLAGACTKIRRSRTMAGLGWDRRLRTGTY